MLKHSSAEMNIGMVHDYKICSGCGACCYICPSGSVTYDIDEKRGTYRFKVDEGCCRHCGRCNQLCPGLREKNMSLRPETWVSHQYDKSIGYYHSIFNVFASEIDIRKNAASGGFVTALLLHLLRNRMIDGALLTSMNIGVMPEPILATTEEEILSAQQSKYCPNPFLRGLHLLRNKGGRYAVVALPCQIQALRKMEKCYSEMCSCIKYMIGLFCSRSPSFNATKYVLRKYDVKLGDVERLEYRAGSEHVGCMLIRHHNGKDTRIPHLHADYWGGIFKYFYIPPRCYLCSDKVAYLADIACGDNWSGCLKDDWGSSSVIIRDAKMKPIVMEMRRRREIVLEWIDDVTLIGSQNLLKKSSIGARLAIWKMLGEYAPDYENAEGLTYNPITLMRALPSFLAFYISHDLLRPRIVRVLNCIYNFSGNVMRKAARLGRVARKCGSVSLKVMCSIAPCRVATVEKHAQCKVLIIGGYGYRDIGDEAMPEADILNMKKIHPFGLEIVMVSSDPAYTIAYHRQRVIKDVSELGLRAEPGVRGIFYNITAIYSCIVFFLSVCLMRFGITLRLWPSARQFLVELASSDVLFNAGGGNLNSLTRSELYKKGCQYLAAKILGVPVIISGQTVGPIYGISDKIFTRIALNSVKMITFRDKCVSRRRCLELKIKHPLMMDAADDAMMIPVKEKEEAIRLVEGELGHSFHNSNGGLNVVMNFKGSLKLFQSGGKICQLDDAMEKMALIADRLVDVYGAKVAFMATDYCIGVDDRDAHRRIVSKTKNKSHMYVFEEEYNAIELKSMIACFDLAIGARYHFCVFAASTFTPFLGFASGVYQMTKISGLSALVGISETYYEHDFQICDLNGFWERIVWLYNKQSEIRMRLARIVPDLQARSMIGINAVHKILSGSVRCC